MAKIFSILTLLAAGLALYLGMESGKRIKEIQDAGSRVQGKLVKTEGDLKQTQEKLKTTEEQLAATTAELEGTKEKLRTTEADLTKTKGELATATAEIEKTKAELTKINDQIAKFFPGADISKGLEELTTKIADLSSKAMAAEAKAAELEKQKAELDATVKTLESTAKEKDDRIATQGTTIKRYTDGIMQKGVRGRVMAVNSGWGFAVLSVGDRQGAAASKVMIVARGGQAIGKVRITNVEATQSVADILPGSFVKGAYVQPGDEVIYTGDDKVKAEEAASPAPAATVPAPELPR